MSTLYKAMSLFLFCLFCFSLISCNTDTAGNPKNVTANKSAPTPSIVNYGNGVFYFDAVRANFGNTVSEFIGKNPDLELISVAPNDASHGYTTGYFVFFRKKT